MFRRTFTLNGEILSATLYVCGLGIGRYSINGQPVSGDLLTAPFGDYNKTLWYNVYNVTPLVRGGDNVAAAILGNGYYNEPFKTPWDFHQAAWRDSLKFAWRLDVVTSTGTFELCSDEQWRVTHDGPVTFNALRSGEYFDARKYDANWDTLDYDDSGWDCAALSTKPPRGTFRECTCEPVRECAVYPAQTIRKTGEGTYVFDIGQNIAGYVRLCICGDGGNEITIRYAEQLHDDGRLNLNNMEAFYPESPFQTDKFICNGQPFTWSPMFVYHGFRYIELSGLTVEPTLDMVSGVFIHQDVPELTTFECSNALFNKLYVLGKLATLSNLHYMPTDCPTREKLGWANDAQASCEQMLTHFGVGRLFRKWLVDVADAVRADGALPGIIPTAGWGYEWGNGPVSDGILFEIPYSMYGIEGDKAPLIENRGLFRKYLDYLYGNANGSGLIDFGLCDWAGPVDDYNQAPTPTEFTSSILYIKFIRIAKLAAKEADDICEYKYYDKLLRTVTDAFTRKYVASDGTCIVDEQTAVSMLIYHELYSELEPLKLQLARLVEQRNYHHNCGMVGLRRLFHALSQCGLHEHAYKVATSTGFPSYASWVEGGATTLWETWQCEASKNHHMYSDIINWLFQNIIGIMPVAEGYKTVRIAPHYFAELTYAEGSRITPYGTIKVQWKRVGDTVELHTEIPQGITVVE